MLMVGDRLRATAGAFDPGARCCCRCGMRYLCGLTTGWAMALGLHGAVDDDAFPVSRLNGLDVHGAVDRGALSNCSSPSSPSRRRKRIFNFSSEHLDYHDNHGASN